MTYEAILEEVGTFGIYQKVLCFLLIPLTTLLCGMNYYTLIFVLTIPTHWCGDLAGNDTFTLDPAQNTSAEEADIFYISESTSHSSSLNITETSQAGRNCSCPSGWKYDYTNIFPTIASQNDWVCDDSWRPYTIITFFWIGNTIGAFVFVSLSDKFGRRPLIAIALILHAVFGVISVFVTNFTGFLVLRFMQGTVVITVSHLPFIYVIEFCGVKSRVIPLLTVMISFTLSALIASGLALLVWDWKIITLATSAPAIIIVPFYRWLPESPSWLLSTGRKSRALSQLILVGRTNGHKDVVSKLSQSIQVLDSESAEEKKRAKKKVEKSVVKVFKYPRLRRNVLLVLVLWVLACLCYFGHIQNTASISSNIFSNFIFGSLVEIPSWSVPFFINKIGRKPPLAVGFLISGACGVAYAALLPLANSTLSLIIALLGRMFATVSYYLTLQYCPELFPTVIRGQLMALAEALGGVGIFVSPLIVYLGEYHNFLPLTIFGILSFISFLACLALPETAGKMLPQTLQEGDNFRGEPSRMLRFIRRQESGQTEIGV